MYKTLYVLKAKEESGDYFSDGYYTGNMYIYQGEYYAVVDDLDKAKKYTSLKRAESAANSLFNKIVNYEFCVKEIKVGVDENE